MRFMVWLSLTLGRQLSRTVLHGIAIYFRNRFEQRW